MTTTRRRKDMIWKKYPQHAVDIRHETRWALGTTVSRDHLSIYFFLKQHYELHKKENVVYIALEYLPGLHRSSIHPETKWSSCLRRQYDNPYNLRILCVRRSNIIGCTGWIMAHFSKCDSCLTLSVPPATLIRNSRLIFVDIMHISIINDQFLRCRLTM